VLKFRECSIILLWPFFFFEDGSWGAAKHFMVAATRLGSVPNPKWCFSDTPFRPTVGADNTIGNTDPMSYLITHSFDPANQSIATSTSPMEYVACESII
jgi:hypothetical protein